MSSSQFIRYVLKPLTFAASLIPFAALVTDLYLGRLGANPVEELTHRTGDWTLIFLMITLAVTPIRRLTGFGAVVRFRRMAGLFAFFYALVHFSTYIVFDHYFDFDAIIEDVAKRPYVTVGFTSLILLAPLALTSTKGWVKRLGGKRWKRLHQTVYLAAAGGVLHYLWLVKADTRRPEIFGLVLVALLATRLWRPRKRRQAVSAKPSAVGGQPSAVGSERRRRRQPAGAARPLERLTADR